MSCNRLINELSLLQKQLNLATPDRCVSVIQLLSKSLSIVNMEKKKIDRLCCQDYEEYCEQVYEIGRNMIDLIKDYGKRLDDFLEKNTNKQNSDSSNSSFSTISCKNMPEINYENILNELNVIQNQLDTSLISFIL